MELITLSQLSKASGQATVIGVPETIYTIIYSVLVVLGALGVGMAGFAAWRLLRHGMAPFEPSLVFIGGFGFLVASFVYIALVFAIPASPPQHWLVRAENDALVINANPVFSRALQSRFAGDPPSCMVIPYKDMEFYAVISEQVPDGNWEEFLYIILRDGTGDGVKRFLSGLKQARKQAAAQLNGRDAVNVFIAPVSSPAPNLLVIQDSGYYYYKSGQTRLSDVLRDKGVQKSNGDSVEAPGDVDLRTRAGANYLIHLVEMNQVDAALTLMGAPAGRLVRTSSGLDVLAKTLTDGTLPDLASLQQPPRPRGLAESISGQAGPVGYLFLVFFAFFVLMGLAYAVTGAKTLQQALQSKSWSDTEGVITASAVADYRVGSLSSASERRSREPSVSYRYSVQGREYEADRIAFCSTYFDSAADAYVHSHPAGTPVTVYSDPEDPAQACLEPGFTLGLLAPFVYAAIIIAMGLIPPYLMFRHGQGKLMGSDRSGTAAVVQQDAE